MEMLIHFVYLFLFVCLFVCPVECDASNGSERDLGGGNEDQAAADLCNEVQGMLQVSGHVCGRTERNQWGIKSLA